jgi:hypothetical protein
VGHVVFRGRHLTASLATLALLAALSTPVAAATKQKASEPLYTVSLAGTVQLESTETREGLIEPPPLPADCVGYASETERLTASARFSARTAPIAVASYGHRFHFLLFKLAFSSLSAAGSSETSGSYSVDPNAFDPPSPSECVFTPKRTDAHCEFTQARELERGVFFQLSPNLQRLGNQLFLYRGGAVHVEVHCDQVPVEASFFPEEPGLATSLRLSALTALRKGKSLSDSATVTHPVQGLEGKQVGTETVDYRIRIRRVH